MLHRDCRYAKAVGNRAVQEAFAAKSFVGAQFAAVVTNASYTTSARQLAASTGVLLLHFTDLARPSRHFGLADRPSSHRPSQVTAAKVERLRRQRVGVPYALTACAVMLVTFSFDAQKVAPPAKTVASALQPSPAVVATAASGEPAAHHPKRKGHRVRREP